MKHPHLLEMYSFCDNADGNAFESNEPKNPFLLMELIKGKTLESFIRKRPTKEIDANREFQYQAIRISRRRLNIAIQLANAVSEIHRNRLIHRDIKPANIFLASKVQNERIPIIKVGDFGIVKWGDFHSSLSTGVLTATNQKGLGTIKYMAPEQAITPRDVTPKADVFSLGITFFELFAGQILPSPYHVFEIINARQTRGTTTRRYSNMGYTLRDRDEWVAGLVLDMMTRASTRRPSIQQVEAKLQSEYERRYEIDWESDHLLETREIGADTGSWDED